MTFDGAKDFADFLRARNNILMILPWGSDLVNYVDGIEKGCKCKRKARISQTNAVYKSMVLNTIKKNKDVQHFLKKEIEGDSMIFKLEEKVIAEI